jgi:hypothetical protein
VASTTEDVAAVGGLALAFSHPGWALGLLTGALGLLALAAWLLWRGLRRVGRTLRGA